MVMGVVFFPGHFSVAKSHAALPDRHSAFLKGKFRHAPLSITSLLPYDLTWSAKSASLTVCDAPTVLDLLERRQRLIDYINRVDLIYISARFIGSHTDCSKAVN